MEDAKKKENVFCVKVDTTNNLLMISLFGNFDEDDGRRLEERVREKLPNLSNGFGLLNDMTLLEKMTPAANPSHQRIMDMCNAAGVAKIARVFGDKKKDTGFSIMSNFHYNWDVGISTHDTVSEAFHYLLKQNNHRHDQTCH